MSEQAKYEKIRCNLFSDTQALRDNAIEEAGSLSKHLAVELFKDGLNFWDRKVRIGSAIALCALIGADAVPLFLEANKNGLIPSSLTADLVADYPSEAIYIYLKKTLANKRYKFNRDKAYKALYSVNSEEATYARLNDMANIDALMGEWLVNISAEGIAHFIKKRSFEWQVKFSENNSNLDYICDRGLKNTVETIARNIIGSPNLADLTNFKLLDFLNNNELGKYLKEYAMFVADLVKSDVGLKDYLTQRGLIDQLERVEAEKEVEQVSIGKVESRHTIDDFSPLAKELDLSETLLVILYTKWEALEKLYKIYKMPKKNGAFRELAAPGKYLKLVQKRIMEKVLYKQELHSCCHGFRPHCSTITNALPHVKKKICINLDLKDFFPTITANRVYGLFLSLGYDQWSASFLTRLTTFKEALPQGAPTSPAISNLICRRLDKRLAKLAEKVAADYTRYADDLTFSSNEDIKGIIPLITKIIESEGFEVARNKLRLTRKGNRQEVTGLVVNDKVAIPRHIRRKLRAVMHRYQNGKEIEWNGSMMSRNSLAGHLSYLRSVQPDLGQTYFARLKQYDD